MNRNCVNFDNIKKSDFYNKNKKIFNIDDTDVNKMMLISKKETYGEYNSFKYFIGYNDNDVIRPLYLFLSQTIGFITNLSVMIKDIQRLRNYNKIWKKIEKSMKIDFNTKTTYGNDYKYIKTKIKTYKNSIITIVYNKNESK